MIRALPLLAIPLLAAPAAAGVHLGAEEVRRLYLGGTEVESVFLGSRAVYDASPPTGTAATITGWGATKGAGKTARLTLARSELPVTITMSAALTGAVRWDLWRITSPGASTVAAAGTTATVSHAEALNADFHPSSSGWTYHLVAYAAGGHGLNAASDLTVRVITPPTLTAFAASPPASVSAPFVVQTCSTLTWAATAGDPPASWSITQTGSHVLAHLPSDARAGPASSPQRVCTTRTTGGSTILTLAGANEAGSVSRAATIVWPSQ